MPGAAWFGTSVRGVAGEVYAAPPVVGHREAPLEHCTDSELRGRLADSSCQAGRSIEAVKEHLCTVLTTELHFCPELCQLAMPALQSACCVCVAAFEDGTDIADTRVRRYDGRRNPIPTATYQDRFLRRVPYITCLQTVKQPEEQHPKR